MRAALFALALALPTAAQSLPVEGGHSLPLANGLVPSDPSQAVGFGRELAVSGSRAAVAAPGSAAVYVFAFDGAGWLEEARLVAWDGLPSIGFGGSVAISGDRLVVGAAQDDTLAPDAGAAYLFRRASGAWVPDGKLTGSDGAAGDWFGYRVAVDGKRVVVGALFGESPFLGDDIGKLYAFASNGRVWNETAKIDLPGGGYGNDGFGYSLALSGTTLAVGAPYFKDLGHDTGQAYVFEQDGAVWQLEASLGTIGEFGLRELGASLSLDGDLLAVGAPGDGAGEFFETAGAVYVHRRGPNGWKLEAKIAPDDTFWDDIRFGDSVAVRGDHLYVGASDGLDGKLWSGAVYTYEKTRAGWACVAKSTGDADFAQHGDALACGDGFALVGAPGLAPAAGTVTLRPLEVPHPELIAAPAHLVFHDDGAVHAMKLDFGPGYAGRLFAVLGTNSGTSPGTLLDGVEVPLNPDAYLTQTIGTPGATPLVGSMGVLDPDGRATVAFVVPPGGFDFSLTETWFHHAAVLFDTATGEVVRASNPTPVGIVY